MIQRRRRLTCVRLLADKTEALCRERRATPQGAHSGREDIDELVFLEDIRDATP